MTDEIYSLLKSSHEGHLVIGYINGLEKDKERLRVEVDMLTLARKTAVEQLRIELDENIRLKQIIDADEGLVCVSKPMCRKG